MTLVVEYLGWVNLDLGSSPGWWAATVATYSPIRMVEHIKYKSTQPRYSTTSHPVAGTLQPVQTTHSGKIQHVIIRTFE